MFDIGAAGPWAGVMLAIPAVIIGLYLSDVTPLDKSVGGLELGNSLLFVGLSHLVLGIDPSTVNVNLNPIAFAGWLGLFVTTLNLLPVGQLDGGVEFLRIVEAVAHELRPLLARRKIVAREGVGMRRLPEHDHPPSVCRAMTTFWTSDAPS